MLENIFSNAKYRAFVIYFDEGYFNQREGNESLENFIFKYSKEKIFFIVLKHIYAN
jgi:hypothetical protein